MTKEDGTDYKIYDDWSWSDPEYWLDSWTF